MRVRWQFYFDYEDIKFEKKYEYVVHISKEHAEAFGLRPEEFDATLTVEAEKERHGERTQLGIINIFLPGRGEETKDLAYSLAISFTQQVTFSQAKITIDGGFISNELLPETPEEEAEVGENRFSWTVQIKQVPEQIPFDSASIQKVTNNPLIRQFNEANNANSSVDRFIGLFKILEDLYGGRPVKKSLKQSRELREIALKHIRMREGDKSRRITDGEFDKLAEDLSNTRHQCAHLRSSDGFGITYGDARVNTEIEPLLPSLEKLAYEAVQKRIA